MAKVQDVTSLINDDIKYIKEAIELKSNHEEAIFNEYIERMKKSLNGRITLLNRISCNDKLKAKYNKLVDEMINIMNKIY